MKWSFKKYLLLAFGFTLASYPIMDLLVLNPFEHEADFELSDFFMRTKVRYEQKRLSDNIIIVASDNLNRREIVETAKFISDSGAATTVIDILMDWKDDGDDSLVELLNQCHGLVVPEPDEEGYSLYHSVQTASFGNADLSTPSFKGEVIRRHIPCSDGHESLAYAAATAYDGNIPNCDGKERLIDFSCVLIDAVPADSIRKDPSLINGRIVIIGDINNHSDTHETPVGSLSGAAIHAHIIDCILKNRAPVEWPKWISVVLSIVLCTLLFLLNLYVNLIKENGDLANLLMRLSQAVLLVLIYCIGSVLFVKHNLYFDTSVCLLLIATESILVDTVLGIRAICQICIKRKNQKHHSDNQQLS